jgi:phospholipid/cholesterol/gamma-HCH transport system substrate-binding protein
VSVSKYIKIALFFIVLFAGGIVYIIMSADGISGFNTRTYEAVLADATGLSTRSKVYLAGVIVGKVQDIQLTGTEARLKINFLKDVDIRQDAVISRKTNSILGTSVLSLDPGMELSPILPPGSFINTERNPGDMGALMGTVQNLGGQIAGLLDEFQKNQMALLAVSLETFNSVARKIDSNADEQLENVSRILASAAIIAERTEGLLSSGQEDINASVRDIRESLANIRSITDDLRSGRGNVGRVLNDERLYDSLLATAEQTQIAAEKLKNALISIDHLAQNVDGVVTSAGEIVDRAAGLGIQVDAGGRYDIISEQMRAGASIRLDPRSKDRWYRIGVNSAPEGVPSRTVKETTDGLGVVTREDITETRYTVSIDAEIARRFGYLTIRGGLLESSAGIGLDVQPIPWLALSGDFFNFRTGEVPNVRGSITVYPFFDPDSDKPWNWIYLKGGITDALSGNRDYFFGAGLRFADREVKGLVGLAPAFN